jgi:hypothetical protein
VQLSDIEIKTNIANLQARLLFYQQNQQNFKYISPIIEQIEQFLLAKIEKNLFLFIFYSAVNFFSLFF